MTQVTADDGRRNYDIDEKRLLSRSPNYFLSLVCWLAKLIVAMCASPLASMSVSSANNMKAHFCISSNDTMLTLFALHLSYCSDCSLSRTLFAIFIRPSNSLLIPKRLNCRSSTCCCPYLMIQSLHRAIIRTQTFTIF